MSLKEGTGLIGEGGALKSGETIEEASEEESEDESSVGEIGNTYKDAGTDP